MRTIETVVKTCGPMRVARFTVAVQEYGFESINPVFEQYLPDGKNQAYLGYQGFSAWLLFATAAKECGADLTRQCVLDELAKIDSWTGGGLHAETNPAENMPPDSTVAMARPPRR